MSTTTQLAFIMSLTIFMTSVLFFSVPATLTIAICSCSCVPMLIMCALLVYSCVVARRDRTSSFAISRADATSPRLAASRTCFCAAFSSLQHVTASIVWSHIGIDAARRHG